ncbi:hypothetical protein LPB79_13010 [Rhizobium sp. T136]|uniref:hypothetical protein n=1 Tax=Rhizobium sp. T136 TaxID=555319 RepID=UPI001E57506C|nr:hypothetical protein [Rhizobium sp. T136]UFS83166.1 hypothetical protein LPB79_13010 [Rhizobium sp. T136]
MTATLSLKIVGLPRNEWFRAHRVANHFVEEYPDRIGMRHGCVYSPAFGDYGPVYVYRTKTQVVVRASSERSEVSL